MNGIGIFSRYKPDSASSDAPTAERAQTPEGMFLSQPRRIEACISGGISSCSSAVAFFRIEADDRSCFLLY